MRRSVLMKSRRSRESCPSRRSRKGGPSCSPQQWPCATADAGGNCSPSATEGLPPMPPTSSPTSKAAPPGWPSRSALDLTNDSAILTALANDVGPEVLFQRQVIAYARKGDAVPAISTSGGSKNIVEALTEARRRGLTTMALVGYDGGRVATERLADNVIVSRSQKIPRIQEAQASTYHVSRARQLDANRLSTNRRVTKCQATRQPHEASASRFNLGAKTGRRGPALGGSRVVSGPHATG